MGDERDTKWERLLDELQPDGIVSLQHYNELLAGIAELEAKVDRAEVDTFRMAKMRQRIGELDEQLAGHAHRIECDAKLIAKLEAEKLETKIATDLEYEELVKRGETIKQLEARREKDAHEMAETLKRNLELETIVSKLEDRMLKMLTAMAQVEMSISAHITSETDTIVPVARDSILEWAVTLGGARYVKPDRIRELAIAFHLKEGPYDAEMEALSAEIERVLKKEESEKG